MASQYAEDIATIKANTGNIIKSLDTLSATVKDNHDAQIEVNTAVNTRVTRLEERMGIWGAAQAAYATVTAVVAGFIGTRQ